MLTPFEIFIIFFGWVLFLYVNKILDIFVFVDTPVCVYGCSCYFGGYFLVKWNLRNIRPLLCIVTDHDKSVLIPFMCM